MEDFDAPFAQGAAGAPLDAGSDTGGGAGTSTPDGSPDVDAPAEADAPAGETLCMDNKDNDEDGLVDCADPDCQAGFECVPEPPWLWDGYFRIREIPWSDPEPTEVLCPDGTAPERLYRSPGPDYKCGCTCGSPSNVECQPARLECSTTSATCQDLQDVTGSVDDGSCFHGTSPDVQSCLFVDPSPEASATCDSNLGEEESPPWEVVVDVCDQPEDGGGGCGDGSMCVPRGGSDYAGSVCVRTTGKQSICPGGWHDRTVAWASGIDLRGCTGCTCNLDPSSVGCTDTGYKVYGNLSCSGSGKVIGASCEDLTPLTSDGNWSARLSSSPVSTAPGTCVPEGGKAVGDVVPSNPSTFCCR